MLGEVPANTQGTNFPLTCHGDKGIFISNSEHICVNGNTLPGGMKNVFYYWVEKVLKLSMDIRSSLDS